MAFIVVASSSKAAYHIPFVIVASSFIVIIVVNKPFVITVPLLELVLMPMLMLMLELKLASAFAAIASLLVVMPELLQPRWLVIVVITSSSVVASFGFGLRVNLPLDQVQLVQLIGL